MKIHNFKELLVWQKALELCVYSYKMTAYFPKEEKFGLTSQIQRCAVSIASNIAEGSGRVSDKEFKHFISLAMGSSFELETQVTIASKLNYLSEQQLSDFNEFLKPVQKMAFGLYNKLEMNTQKQQS